MYKPQLKKMSLMELVVFPTHSQNDKQKKKKKI